MCHQFKNLEIKRIPKMLSFCSVVLCGFINKESKQQKKCKKVKRKRKIIKEMGLYKGER
jgi:hypothetical protein